MGRKKQKKKKGKKRKVSGIKRRRVTNLLFQGIPPEIAFSIKQARTFPNIRR